MAPRLTKSIYFSIDDNVFQAQVDDVNYVPASPMVYRGLDPATVYADMPAGEGVLNIVGVQDYETVGSLSAFLLANQGTTATVIFSPRAAGTAYFTVDVIVAAGAIGGPRNQFGKLNLKLQCVGEVASTTAPEEESS